ncbi:hypothetical protein [Kribbella sp.]|uniref:hypothetical protein n=1 Tax=Kribbella sp. TaxID=1871183 RepID=UPI002D2BA331|nr:hypothetical protein [Kribbella sp.]HZX02183.1 hypothetical protein [Kribbella sp.]
MAVRRSDEVWGLAADPAGGVCLTRFAAGDFVRMLIGGKDIVVARVDGVLTWRDQFGTSGNGTGAGIAVDTGGSVYVRGFTDGALETPLGSSTGYWRTRRITRRAGRGSSATRTTMLRTLVRKRTCISPQGVDGVQLCGLTGTDVSLTSFTTDGTSKPP